MSSLIPPRDPEDTLPELPEDNDTPASLPDDGTLAQDTDLAVDYDRDEVYQHGEASAIGYPDKDPSSRSAVEDYNPDKNQQHEPKET